MRRVDIDRTNIQQHYLVGIVGCDNSDMAKRLVIKAAIRSLGKCCGVWRRHHKRRAFCSKCGSSIVLPKL